MPEIKVAIEYDWPDDPYWLNPDTVAQVLGVACRNTNFTVKWVEGGDPWKESTELRDNQCSEELGCGIKALDDKGIGEGNE